MVIIDGCEVIPGYCIGFPSLAASCNQVQVHFSNLGLPLVDAGTEDNQDEDAGTEHDQPKTQQAQEA